MGGRHRGRYGCHLALAQVLIDIGEGVTDMAVIRGGRIVHASAVRTACSDLQQAVHHAVMASHKINLGQAELERLTHELSSLSRQAAIADRIITVTGLDSSRRCLVSTGVESQDVVGVMEPVLGRMLEMIESGLRQLPENAACEIVETGICLTGGGARIAGIDRLIAERTGLSVRVAMDPLHSVINGAIETLKYWEGKERWWKNLAWPELHPHADRSLPVQRA